jgi:ribosomal protein S18 acetylase RimI-like enzyme
MGLQVKIEVHAENIYAIRLYEKMGFKPLGNYNIYIIRNLNNTNSMGTM